MPDFPHLIGSAILLIGLATSTANCQDDANAIKPFFHEKYGWKAELFYDDPQVIALCKAIQANNLEEMKRLIKAGADVNAKGKGNMTPLLWAYPENHPERFKLLLEHGADPNVIFKSDFNTRMSMIRPGDSITHMVCDCYFPKYFDSVFEHGGDPNLIDSEAQETPIFPLIKGLSNNKIEKVKRLIALGADLEVNKNNEYKGYTTPVDVATTCFAQYDIALVLLEAGADFKHHRPDHPARLIHLVQGAKGRLPSMGDKKREDYFKLVKWLEAHGESIAEATKDKKRWKTWKKQGTFKENMAKELADLIHREAAKEAQDSDKQELEAQENK